MFNYIQLTNFRQLNRSRSTLKETQMELNNKQNRCSQLERRVSELEATLATYRYMEGRPHPREEARQLGTGNSFNDCY